MMPIIEKISRIRDVFFSRTPKDDSMTPPPFESIRNWNSADEFMDGAWTAYNEAIRAILLSADKEAPLPAALFTPEVELPILHFTELPETWRFQGRFTAIAGPRSLEGLHEMTSGDVGSVSIPFFSFLSFLSFPSLSFPFLSCMK